MRVKKFSIQTVISSVFSTKSMHNHAVANKFLKDIELYDDPNVYQLQYRRDQPKEFYALSKRLNWTDSQYLESINCISGSRLTSRFWTNELSSYINTVQLSDFNLEIVLKLHQLRANLSTSQVKETVIQKINLLDPMQRLTVIDDVLSSKHRPLHGLFSLQRGWTKPSLGHGSFKILADMRKRLKEQVIDFISQQPESEQLKLVTECLKVGTSLNKLFTTQRGFFKVSMRHGTLKKLSDMKERLERLSVSFPTPKTIPKPVDQRRNELSLVDRLKAIGYSLANVPEELCCKISMEIMSEPIRLASREDAYFDKNVLKEHIKMSKMTTHEEFVCPLTNQTLFRHGVLENVDAEKRRQCVSFVEKEERAYRERQVPSP